MSHFFVVVLVPQDVIDIEGTVEKLMAPYDENIQVEPYERSYGTETYTTTRNPQAKWDYWRIGGRWDGFVRNDPRRSESGFNFSEEHEHLGHNTLRVREFDHALTPFAVVTPDGQWHEKGRMGWFGLAHNEKEKEDWEDEILQLIRSHHNCTMVGLDCHI